MANDTLCTPTDEEFLELKERCKPLFDEDPTQYHDDASLWRFLKAFKTSEFAYKMLLKTNKWREEMKVDELNITDPDVEKEFATGKGVLLSQKDNSGRPILYISAKKHNAYERDIDASTKFIVYMLEKAVKKCTPECDNLCIAFDLKDFCMSNMDYQFVKQLITVLGKYYPERLGICLILNAPMIFYGCWAIIRPWLVKIFAKLFYPRSENISYL
ncbi:DgyrCDS1812 [Dimorphilus gyrociliatus]|uniref:DgyrCDS1812 n=1 Tax=Dimorphilus gyrociliatus TaxID=2664684 RepID=A0A7I8V9V3_9ANNE|nr:DgyrCDS1812 [Dimorphilus gyrociliatus]